MNYSIAKSSLIDVEWISKLQSTVLKVSHLTAKELSQFTFALFLLWLFFVITLPRILSIGVCYLEIEKG